MWMKIDWPLSSDPDRCFSFVFWRNRLRFWGLPEFRFSFPASLAVSGSCSTGWVRVEVGKIGYSFIPECIKIASTVGWVSVPGLSVIISSGCTGTLVSFLAWPAPANRQLSLVSSTVIWIPFHRIVRVLNTIIRKCRKDRIHSDPLTLRATKEGVSPPDELCYGCENWPASL